ncbi:MAG TPA: G5 domain-containing protein, partial [Actinoplanes sp.]|nr:G5 domain-containing protein [Actinoplanes sp.]
MTAGASALLVMIGGGTAGIAALTEEEPRIVTAAGADRAAATAAPPPAPGTTAPQPPPADSRLGVGLTGQAEGVGAKPVGEGAIRRTSEEADRTATRSPRSTTAGDAPVAADQAPAMRQPVVTTRTVVEKRAIPYRTRLIRDPDLPRGRKRVQTAGVPGEQTLRWLITYSDGRPTDRRLVDATVTRPPQHRVVAFGTRRDRGDGPRECRPGSDHCFPIGRSAACPA